MLGRIQPVLLVEWNDDLAVRMRLEVVRLLQRLSNDAMVVDLAVDCQCNSVVIVDQRLSACVHAHYTKALVAQDGVVASPVPRPVWTPMSQALYTL